MTPRGLTTQARRLWARVLLAIVAAIARDRVVPLDVVLAIRRIGPGIDPLVPPARPKGASHVRPDGLARCLDGVELGTWALGPRSLEVLVSLVAERRPRTIFEFGSGASTVALAWAMREFCGPTPFPRVISIEQDEAHAEKTRILLGRTELQDEVVVLVAPLAEQVIQERTTICYSIPAGVSEVLGGREIDLFIIDGPAGPAGARFGTLPLLRRCANGGARFVLDDALRDGELGIARLWGDLPYVRLDGIRLIEKGLLMGTLQDSR